jgi:acyl-coenzyme A thioesterase PaaI-like protein
VKQRRVEAKPPRVLSEWQGKWLLSLYPTLLFSRIRITRVGPGFRFCSVRIARSLITRNLNGTTFGGTIFSAADPFYAVMYWQIFARRGIRVQTWLKSARIEYLKPASTALTLDFALTDQDIARAERQFAREGRFVGSHSVEAVDRHGNTCAVIETEVYLRLPRADQKEGSTF